MEKKLKMWIAVGVVVILILFGGSYIYYYYVLHDDSPISGGEITLDVSENETAYIVSVISIRMENHDKGTVDEDGKLNPPEINIYIRRNNESWVRPLTYKTEDLGLQYVDVNKNNYFDKGDIIIIDKGGGSEYSPEPGDIIYLIEHNPHVSYSRSNNIVLP